MDWDARHFRRRLRPADANPGPLLNADTNINPDPDADPNADAHRDADSDAKAHTHTHAHSLLGYAGLYTRGTGDGL